MKLPKKGEAGNGNNWRGITLLSVPSKVLSKIILDRRVRAVDPLLRREQAGFRPNRSCVDHINTLRVIIEQASEWQRGLYTLFVDFEKAFDTVRWESMWTRLKRIGVPNKIIGLIQAAYAGYACRVIHNGELSDEIEVQAGVRQGCLLSPLLFLITLDCVLHDALDNHSRGIQWGLHDQLESLEYADDICLLSHTQEAMAAKLEDIRREAGKVGLKINAAKTKEIRAGTGNARPILLSAEPVERVQHFTYLGSVVSEDGGASEDVDARIAKARIAFTPTQESMEDVDGIENGENTSV